MKIADDIIFPVAAALAPNAFGWNFPGWRWWLAVVMALALYHFANKYSWEIQIKFIRKREA